MNQKPLSIAAALVMISMLALAAPAFAENDQPSGGQEFGNMLENWGMEGQSSIGIPSISPESPATAMVENTCIIKLTIKVNENTSNVGLVVQQLVAENFGSYGTTGNFGFPSGAENFGSYGTTGNFGFPSGAENFGHSGTAENFGFPGMSTSWESTAARSQIYHYFKVTAENMTDSQIENVDIEFAVKKSWISEYSIDEETITCNRLENESVEIPTSGGGTISRERLTPVALPTTRLGEDTTYIYFTSTSPGLSYFTITGESRDNTSSGGSSSGSLVLGIVIITMVVASIAVLFYERRKWV